MSIPIEQFYAIINVDPYFDENQYILNNPGVANFYQPHCQDNGISEKYRLYFHYIMYNANVTSTAINIRKLFNYKDTLSNKKYIYLKPMHGIANRILNICSFVDFAKKYQFNKIYVCWSESKGFSSDKFTDLFDIDSIDPLIEFIDPQQYQYANEQYFALDAVVDQDQYTLEYHYRIPSFGIINHITNHTFCYNWFAAIQYMFPDIIHTSKSFTNNLKPSQNVRSKMDLVSFPVGTIGVHIRRGDALKTNYGYLYHRSTNQSFIATINKSQDKYFFLSTDCKETQNQIIQSCPDKNILIYDKKFCRADLTENEIKDNQIDAAVDMFLLSETKEILGNKFSTFGVIASTIGNIPFTEITADQAFHNIHIDLPPISVVIGVKDRYRPLITCLQSWINQDAVKDILVVDWDSTDMDKSYVEGLDPRVRVVTFSNKPQYHLSKAVNECIKRAKYDHIIKSDVDYIANPYLQLHEWLDLNWESEFLTGTWTQKNLDNSMGFMEYLNGLLICKRQHIKKAGMYNESLRGYGYDDTDMYNRLINKAKLTRKIIPNSINFVPIYHNPHPDFHRSVNYINKNIKANMAINQQISKSKLTIWQKILNWI